MTPVYTVKLKDIIKEFGTEEIFVPEGKDILVSKPSLTVPVLHSPDFSVISIPKEYSL